MIARHLPVVIGAMVALTSSATLIRAVGGAPREAAAVSLTAGEIQFITRAVQACEAETALARLAQQRSRDARLTDLAQHIQQAHELACEDLKTLAARKNTAVRVSTHARRIAYDRLTKLSGAEFDRVWVTEIVKGHQQAVAVFTRIADLRTGDADLRSFALKTLPALRVHLKRAQELQQAS